MWKRHFIYKSSCVLVVSILFVADLCYDDLKKFDGTINTSVTRNKCLPWNASFAEEEDLPELKNYCRDLQENKGKPWCFTENGEEVCDVPKCFSNVYLCFIYKRVVNIICIPLHTIIMLKVEWKLLYVKLIWFFVLTKSNTCTSLLIIITTS